jgi:hypothetical protein
MDTGVHSRSGSTAARAGPPRREAGGQLNIRTAKEFRFRNVRRMTPDRYLLDVTYTFSTQNLQLQGGCR